MREPEPLDDWLSVTRWRATPDIVATCLADARQALAELPAAIETGQLVESGMAMLRVAQSTTLSKEEVLQAEALYRRVHATRGKGKNYVQEALLNLVAVSNHPASLPFWVALLDLTRSNDQFRRRRRTFALAALAYHAITRNSDEAVDCLRQAAYHMDEDHPSWTCDAVLGEIGLSKGHKFMYYFDYGDQHRFDVQVVETWPASAVTVRATYPQNMGGQDEAPEQ